MATKVPDVLISYNSSFKSRPEASARYTLESYAGNVLQNKELKELAKVVSPAVYSRFARNVQNGSAMTFGSFLLERCAEQPDTLSTKEYKEAKTVGARKKAIVAWYGKLNAASKTEVQPPQQKIVKEKNATPTGNGIESAVIDFYKSYGKADTAKVVVHTTPFEGHSENNIVVQPPPKQKKNKKEIAIKTDTKEPVSKTDAKETTTKADTKAPVAKTDTKATTIKMDAKEIPTEKTVSAEDSKKVEVQSPPKKDKKNDETSHIENYIKEITNGTKKTIPRKDLEPLAVHLEGLISKGDQKMLPVYQKVVDLIHEGFDGNDINQLANAINMVDIVSMPKRERRALVDLLFRGSKETHEELKKIHMQNYDSITKKKDALQKMADSDLAKFFPKIAEAIEEKTPSSEKRAFVLGHNETPVLRLLLNSRDAEKTAKYMQSHQLASNEVKKKDAVPLAKNPAQTWDPKLSSSKPYVSENGKVMIFASVPYRDNISYFKKWANESGCCDKENSIWLAPTDEVIVSKKLHDKAASWTPKQMKDFVMAHKVKKDAGISTKISDMAAEKGPWITNHKMESGKEQRAAIKTKPIVDQKNGNTYIPICTALC